MRRASITSKENAITEVKDRSIDFDHGRFKYSPTAEKHLLLKISMSILNLVKRLVSLAERVLQKSSFVQLIPRL